MNLSLRLKKLEALMKNKTGWRTDPEFLKMLNKNYNCNFKEEHLLKFREPLEAVICGIEIAVGCYDIDNEKYMECENCPNYRPEDHSENCPDCKDCNCWHRYSCEFKKLIRKVDENEPIISN